MTVGNHRKMLQHQRCYEPRKLRGLPKAFKACTDFSLRIDERRRRRQSFTSMFHFLPLPSPLPAWRQEPDGLIVSASGIVRRR